MKVWYIRTWGGGTPLYIVSATSKEKAWEMVEDAWKKKYHCPVGYTDFDFFGSRKSAYQTADDLVEIEGLIAETSVIKDVCE